MLPIKVRNVYYYRIAGQYIFAGDLYISRRKLYFFPEVDLEEQRAKASNGWRGQFGLIGHLVIYVEQYFGSYKSNTRFWTEGMGVDQFEFQAALLVEQLKSAKMHDKTLLPAPTVIVPNEVSNLKLGGSGVLSFAAQSDTHDFNIGPRRKRLVRDALGEAGFAV